MNGILVNINGFSFLIHQSVMVWLALCIIVSGILYFVGKGFKRADYKVAPKGVLLFFEVIVGFCVSVIGGNFKSKTWRYLPFMGTVMIMMVLSNLAGLFGFQSPTSNVSVNLTLTAIMIFLIHYNDIKLHGVKGKIKSLMEPIAFLFPLNIIGDLALPISLSLRLFGNMLGGTIIVTLLYTLIKALLPYSAVAYFVTPFLHMYFDVFAAFMQTYIYFTLSSFFISEASDCE